MSDCSICGRSKSDTTYLELGPAYNDFKNGIGISRTYEPRKDITVYLGASCCKDFDFEPLYFRPNLHIHLMWTFSLIYVALFVLIIVNRDNQPIKFRGAGHLIFHLTAIFFFLINVIVTSSAKFTGICDLTDINAWFVVPVIYWYYVLKSLQLAFVYKWSFAKLRGDHESSKWYFKYKAFLKPNLMYYWCLFIAVLGLIGYGGSRFSHVFDHGNNFVETGRCFWWNIPQQYTIQQYPSSACACYDSLVLSDTNQESACQTYLLTTCLNGTITIPPLTLTETSELCTACIADGPSSKACQSNFIKWLSTGACGWPRQFPDFSHCFACVYSDPAVYAGWATFKFLIIACILYGTFLTAQMDDKLLVRYEILSLTFGAVPLDIISIIMQNDADFAESLRRVTPDFESQFLLNILECCALLVGSHFVPLIACYYWKSSAKKKSSDVVAVRVQGKSSEMVQTALDRMNNKSQFTSANAGWLEIRDSLGGHVVGLNSDSQHEDLELAFVLENVDAFKIYSDFSCKEFTIENILFLKAVRSFHESLLQKKPEWSLQESKNEGAQSELTPSCPPIDHVHYIMTNFINVDSPMQVNIPARMRTKTEQEVAKLKKNDASEPKHDANENNSQILSVPFSFVMDTSKLHNVIEILDPAVQEVKRLIVRDSWSRFSHTNDYQTFQALFQAEEKGDDILKSNLDKILTSG